MAKALFCILAKRFLHPPWRDRPARRMRRNVTRVRRGHQARASVDEAAYAVTHCASSGRHHRRRAGAALDAASRTCRIRAAFRCHADCAATSAAPSVSSIRRQHLKTHQPRGPAHETECRRPDGPHRAYQHSRRFNLRAAAGGAEARPRIVLLHPGQAFAARRRGRGPGPGADRARRGRRSFYPRRAEARTARRVRRDPAAAGSAIRSRLHHLDAFARAPAPQNAGGERPGGRPQRAGKAVRDEFPAI